MRTLTEEERTFLLESVRRVVQQVQAGLKPRCKYLDTRYSCAIGCMMADPATVQASRHGDMLIPGVLLHYDGPPKALGTVPNYNPTFLETLQHCHDWAEAVTRQHPADFLQKFERKIIDNFEGFDNGDNSPLSLAAKL